MKKIAITTLLVLFSLQICKAQIKIDVKTEFSNKAKLTVIKTGIIATLNNSPNFEVVSTGEDYSLWITGFNRYNYLKNRFFPISKNI